MHDELQALICNRLKVRGLPYNVVCSALKKRESLAAFWGENGFNRGVEVGVNRGKFSECLCLNNPNIELYSIDPWATGGRNRRQERIYWKAKKKLRPYNVTVLRKTSMDALADFEDESLDFAYIDGDHTFDYAAPDIIFWSRKLRSGGMMGVHDYGRHNIGVRDAVDAYTFNNNICPWYVTYEIIPTAFWVKP